MPPDVRNRYNNVLNSNLPVILFSAKSFLCLYQDFIFGIFMFTFKLKVPKFAGHIKSQA